MLKRLEYTSKYSGVAQWWSKKLLTSRLPVRVRPPEPDQAEKSADLVPRPASNFSPWSSQERTC
jgi:hypothetical protein